MSSYKFCSNQLKFLDRLNLKGSKWLSCLICRSLTCSNLNELNASYCVLSILQDTLYSPHRCTSHLHHPAPLSSHPHLRSCIYIDCIYTNVFKIIFFTEVSNVRKSFIFLKNIFLCETHLSFLAANLFFLMSLH